MADGKEAAKDGVKSVEQADVAVTEALADYKEMPLVRAAGVLGDLADQPPMFALSGSVLVAGVVRGDRRLVRTGVGMLAAVLVATASKTAIKRLVDRTRPHLLVDHGHYRLEKGTSTEDGEVNSFPSGHTADAVAAARVVGRVYPGATPVATAAALVVAAVQIPRCRHYLSDVGAGALVGWAAEAGTAALIDRLWPEDADSAPAKPEA